MGEAPAQMPGLHCVGLGCMVGAAEAAVSYWKSTSIQYTRYHIIQYLCEKSQYQQIFIQICAKCDRIKIDYLEELTCLELEFVKINRMNGI